MRSSCGVNTWAELGSSNSLNLLTEYKINTETAVRNKCVEMTTFNRGEECGSEIILFFDSEIAIRSETFRV
jgi:hypothetical protein